MPPATRAREDARPEPSRIQRPTHDHALHLAQAMFLRGERVDMQALAAALDVGRTTLYSWVGDRERLIGDVLAQLSRRTWELVAEQSTGEGLDGALDEVRRFMELTAAFEPLRQFAQREPEPALRVLMSESGAVAEELRAGCTRALEKNLPKASDGVDPDVVDIMVQLATALEWTPIVIGEEPAFERAIHLMRTLLETSARANGRARRRSPAPR